VQTLSPVSALRLPWPLPALGAWGVAWLSFWLAATAGWPTPLALLAALWMPLWLAWRSSSLVRRVLLLAGFPVAMLLQGQVQLPAWSWLLPLVLLLMMYPVRAWRNAPLFPTGGRALHGLAERLSPSASAQGRPLRVLDAGCGLGHGLRALRQQWPTAELHGIEHSVVLAAGAALLQRHARVTVGDMWRGSWAEMDVVYLFQRPETMPRAWDKACAEMRAGTWLVSLEFDLPGRRPDAVLHNDGERPVWAWRVPARTEASPGPAQCPAPAADKSDKHRVGAVH
jgi:hypothetical protein